jgi:hypothetical protein
LTGQVEARLTGVVVAALKEAFDRDRADSIWSARKLDEQRRRARRKRCVRRSASGSGPEVARLRLVVVQALGGFIAAVAMMACDSRRRRSLRRGISAIGGCCC